MPKISFSCPSYNHSNFVGFFRESVLKQACQDVELIIVDICSSDNNVRKIKKFTDKKIKLIEQQYNRVIDASLVMVL
jgi:glycosyltransferase involved in cell wall biosynthesis